MGWLDRNGKITINLPNISSVEEVEKTVVHEGVAHFGLLKLFGNHLNNFLEEVYRKASNSVRSDIANIKARYPFADNYTLTYRRGGFGFRKGDLHQILWYFRTYHKNCRYDRTYAFDIHTAYGDNGKSPL